MYQKFGDFVYWLARLTGIVGGLALLAVVIMSCASIIGRALVPVGLGPVPGDFELVEIGIGFAVFAALPWCHLNRGHATVDLFQPVFGTTLNRLIDLLADALMLIASVLIVWRLWVGMLDKKAYTETTFILQFPVWQAYAICLLGAGVFVLVAAFALFRSGRTLVTGHAI